MDQSEWPLLEMVGNWRNFLALTSAEEVELFYRYERTGRPLGSKSFLDQLEQQLLFAKNSTFRRIVQTIHITKARPGPLAD
jgi:hypothetical protein